MLTGTDEAGNPVELTARTQADGSFDFAELLPGTYTIRQLDMPFMVDGTDTIEGGSNGTAGEDSFTITVTAEGVGDQNFAFVEQGLDPTFAIWEALASAGRNGVYVAVAPGESYAWAQTLAGWDDMTITDIALSANGNRLTITANDSSGTEMEAIASTTDKSKVRSIGQEGNVQLIRLVGDAASFNFTEVTQAAEGENPVDAVFAGGF